MDRKCLNGTNKRRYAQISIKVILTLFREERDLLKALKERAYHFEGGQKIQYKTVDCQAYLEKIQGNWEILPQEG